MISRQQALSIVQAPLGPQKVELSLTQSAFSIQEVLQPVLETHVYKPQALFVRWPQLPVPSQKDADCVFPLQVGEAPQRAVALLGTGDGQVPEEPEQTAAAIQSVAGLHTVPLVYVQIPFVAAVHCSHAPVHETLQQTLFEQMPVAHWVPVEQVAPFPSFCAPQVPSAVQLPVRQSALEAHMLLHDVPSAQIKEPLHDCGVPATQVPAPSHDLEVRVEPEQVEPHAVPLAG